MEYHLQVHHSNDLLAGMDNSFFFYDDIYDDEDIKVSKRNFYLRHPEYPLFLQRMGAENTLYIHRLFLSYYEASVRLREFWRRYASPEAKNLENFTTLKEIENFVNQGNRIIIYDTHALKYANYLLAESERHAEYLEPNSFKEYMWSNNLNELLKNYNLQPFSVTRITGKDIFHSGRIYNLVLIKKEISSALYEWSQINSFNQADFINRISNILELIDNDINRNSVTYDKIQNGIYVRDNVYELNNEVQKSQRGAYFGIFNASELLGPYSRHFSKELNTIRGINGEEHLSIKDVVDKWRKEQLLPSDKQFDTLFKCWYLTTTILLLNWLRLNHEDC